MNILFYYINETRSNKLFNFSKKMIYLTLVMSIFLCNIEASKNNVIIEEIDEDYCEDRSSSKISILPFKIGFEFQEATGLCGWAKHNPSIQKKKLFEVSDLLTLKPLWHVVIDSTDIEFVTMPFSYKEKELLLKALKSITSSINNLKDILNDEYTEKKKSYRQISFEFFVKKISENDLCSVKYFDPYEKIKEQHLTVNQDQIWSPAYAPQVTFQHPLEYAIPLYFSLFGFEGRYMTTFGASIPLKNQFLNAQKEGDDEKLKHVISQFKTKVNGLVFLHALTMTTMASVEYPDLITYVDSESMEPSSKLIREILSSDNFTSCIPFLGKIGQYIEDTQRVDTEQLIQTIESYKKFDQVDVKGSLALMSRRPFSSMFKDIKETTDGSYEQYFQTAMKENPSFFQIPRLFNKTNYGEQFFNENGTLSNLISFKNSLERSFVSKNDKIIEELLKNGIISTTMLRNLKPEIKASGIPISEFMNQYYIFSLKTVDHPGPVITLELDDENQVFFQRSTQSSDVLSPPTLLHTDNSMGAIKNNSFIEKEYGEAIIEIRAISSVIPWFLKRCSLNPSLEGSFLRSPQSTIEHGTALFDYLSNYISDNLEYSIFEAGFSHALRNNPY